MGLLLDHASPTIQERAKDAKIHIDDDGHHHDQRGSPKQDSVESRKQVRKPEPVDPVDPVDVLFPHERSPDASSGLKRSASCALSGDEDHHTGGLLDRPCDKKLKRDDHFNEAGAASDTPLLRHGENGNINTGSSANIPPSTSPQLLLSPLDVADKDQIQQHLRDVRREVFLRPMIAIVTRLMFHKYNHGLFNVRVDPVAWKIPHYYEIVKKPMDLALVKTKCLHLEYASVEDCAADIQLVFTNACLFNPSGHMVHECALLLHKEFDAEYARYQAKKAAQDKRRDDHSCPSCLANVCGICLEKCINFEPPLIMCSGPCKQRIKRHSVYYKTHDRLNYWCAKCYTTLPKVVTLPQLPQPPHPLHPQKQQQVSPQQQPLSKQELVKAKFVDELTEPWVQCDSCDGWVHQVCALFNACENVGSDDVPYSCPLCRLETLESQANSNNSASDQLVDQSYSLSSSLSSSSWDLLDAVPSGTSVDEFPQMKRGMHRDIMPCVAGSHSPIVKRGKPQVKEFARVVLGFDGETQRKVMDYLQSDDIEAAFGKSGAATATATTAATTMTTPLTTRTRACLSSSQLKSSRLSTFMQHWIRRFLVDAGETQVAESIVIKVASCIKSQAVISPIVREHFQSETAQYPETMEYTSKAIFVFQKIDGVEVCIFSMYVQEYDNQAAVVANRNRTYIAYIDSLVYMRPRHIRTSLFHEILISYLGFCKRKGLEYAHIWACPTTRGGDFIYWCHPSFQKNPGKDRLLQWYVAMVDKAKKAGVAYGYEDLYTTDFADLEAKLTAASSSELPPYFDGDYWASEVERLHANPPKRGKLSKEAYEESLGGAKFRKKLTESVKISRESLFVIALQPKCGSCDALMVNTLYWSTTVSDGDQEQEQGQEQQRALLCVACHHKKCEENMNSGEDGVQVELPPMFATASELPKDDENGDEEEDEKISCPFVDYRADLLKNCEERHYQFDSFRRAKYSTMMLIYHIATTQQRVTH